LFLRIRAFVANAFSGHVAVRYGEIDQCLLTLDADVRDDIPNPEIALLRICFWSRDSYSPKVIEERVRRQNGSRMGETCFDAILLERNRVKDAPERVNYLLGGVGAIKENNSAVLEIVHPVSSGYRLRVSLPACPYRVVLAGYRGIVPINRRLVFRDMHPWFIGHFFHDVDALPLDKSSAGAIIPARIELGM
jgi:hypothetical protein